MRLPLVWRKAGAAGAGATDEGGDGEEGEGGEEGQRTILWPTVEHFYQVSQSVAGCRCLVSSRKLDLAGNNEEECERC